MKVIERFFKLVEDLLRVVSFVLLTLMVLNIAGNVLLRYVFKIPIAWSEELARYLMIWLSFFGMSLALKRDEHVNLSFFTSLFPGRIERLLIFLSRVIILIFLGFVFYHSLKIIPVLSKQKSSALQIPMYYPYLSVTVGSALMILHLFYLFLFGKPGNNKI